MSLINLQARTLDDVGVSAQFSALRNRIYACALADEIYSSINVDHDTALARYVCSIFEELSGFYKTNGRIDVTVFASAPTLAHQRCMPFGLILNELVANALAHAFPGERAGTICIAINADGDDIVLRVADTGIGMPVTVDFEQAESLGLRLVRTLSMQLLGTCRLLAGTGTTIEIRFPAKELTI